MIKKIKKNKGIIIKGIVSSLVSTIFLSVALQYVLGNDVLGITESSKIVVSALPVILIINLVSIFGTFIMLDSEFK